MIGLPKYKIRTLCNEFQLGDFFLSYIQKPYVKHYVKIFTGSNISHIGTYIRTNYIADTANKDNYKTHTISEYIEFFKATHIYRLKPNIKSLVDINKFVKIIPMVGQPEYSVSNVFNHLLIKTVKKTKELNDFDLSKINKNIYESNKITCSQLVYRSLLKSTKTKKDRQEIIKILNKHKLDDQSFFPTDIYILSDYQFTIVFHNNKFYKIQVNDIFRKKFDSSSTVDIAIIELEKYANIMWN